MSYFSFLFWEMFIIHSTHAECFQLKSRQQVMIFEQEC